MKGKRIVKNVKLCGKCYSCLTNVKEKKDHEKWKKSTVIADLFHYNKWEKKKTVKMLKCCIIATPV